ncbi:MAG: Trk system potassium transporter TrkA [Lachnospiraceae bacterium]|nr:Trk system potassium transporter TrkA [Lachnospiraceae bacterium]
MKIIVAGCGKVGRTIIEQLCMEGHDISVIDQEESVVNDITDSFDVMGMVGNAASYAVQKEVGISAADLMIAATDSDELNLLCCLIARKAAGCRTIARVRNPEYNAEINLIKEELGLSMVVNPEYAAAVEAARILRFPSAIRIETFAKSRVEIIKFRIPKGSVIDGVKLMDLAARTRTEVLVCTVERGEEVIIPSGGFVLRENDIIGIVASARNTRQFVEKAGLSTRRVNDTMIIGGGKIAYYLARHLIESGIKVKIIDKSEKRCEELCEMLPKAVVINADAADQNVLLEEGIRTCESFVTLTGMDEENLFLSLFAQKSSNAKIITKVNRIAFDDLIQNLQLGTLLNPRSITAEVIIRYVRAMQNSIGSNVRALTYIIKGKVEALEFLIQKGAPVIGVPLKALKIKKNVLIACINHGGEIEVPNGFSRIQEGDTVVVVTSQIGFSDISDILG